MSNALLRMRVSSLAHELLTDDSGNGISEDAYDILRDIILQVLPHDDASEILIEVDATDGRFYIPEDK